MTRPAFQTLQYAFAAHLRDPERAPPPAGIEARRLQIYRDLFYNNIESFLANAFPVMRTLLDDAHWHPLVRRFYANHPCHDPQLHGVARAFVDYLGASGETLAPWLPELAHYEWVELALAVDPAELTPQLADPNGDLLDDVPRVSPLAWPLAYAWPVHRIGPSYQPTQVPAPPTCLVVYRTRGDEVRFMEVNPVTLQLLTLLDSDTPPTGREALLQIAAALQHPQPETLVEEGTAMLAGLRARDILLGTCHPDPMR